MTVETRFSEIGARVKVRSSRTPAVSQWRPDWRPARPVVNPLSLPRIDIRRDSKGEYFDLAVPEGVEMEVIDSDKAARHLVLMARLPKGDKARYLCGHDERHWFVAAIPERVPTTTVKEAKRALQPDAIKDMTVGLSATKRIARHNEAYHRQGEWFFVPAPDFEPDPKDLILRNEPLRRDGRSKPHVVAEAVRSGGEVRYIPTTTNRGFTKRDAETRARAAVIDAVLGQRAAMTKGQMEPLAERFPEVLWRSVLVNPVMYVRGPVRHSDHSTLVLNGWHRVVMNAENLARASAHIAFVD